MKPKQLAFLAVVLVVLLAIAFWRKSGETITGIQEEAGLVSLLPSGIQKHEIAKLAFYAGAKPDDRVVLERDVDDPDAWRVASHYNAPVTEKKIADYLDDISGLSGEFRATAKDATQLEDYNLDDEKAFHVEGFKQAEEEAAFHILVGKRAGRGVFMRANDSNDVYVEDSNLRQSAGLYGDATDQAPKSDSWLDKIIFSLEKDDIDKVSITTPDKHIVLEKRPKEQPEKPEDEADTTDEASKDKAEPKDAEPKEIEYEWVVASGGFDGALKQSGVTTLLSKFRNSRATDIVDPAKKADWKLETPLYRLDISQSTQDDDIVIEGGKPNPTEDGYVRVASNKNDVVYKVSKYSMEQLFPKGEMLFEIPALNIAKEKVERIEITQPEGNVVLERDGDEWDVTAPVSDLPIIESKVSSIAARLRSWGPVDYADSREGSGIDSPTRTARLIAEGESHTVTLGSDSKQIDGVYAQLDDGDRVLTMSRSDVTSIFVAPNDIFKRSLFDVESKDIGEIAIRKGGDEAVVQGTRGNWSKVIIKTSAGTETKAPATAAANGIADALADLEADSLIFDPAPIRDKVMATLEFRDGDGVAHKLTVYEKGANTSDARQRGGYVATVEGLTQKLVLAPGDVATIIPAFDTLKKPEPKAEPKSEEKTDAAADSVSKQDGADASASVGAPAAGSGSQPKNQ